MMKQINRRTFLSQTTVGLGAALALSQLPEQLLAGARAANTPIGFQTYPIRDTLAKDFAGTLKMMAVRDTSLSKCVPRKAMQILVLAR
jgi:hypothetical protein